MSNADIAFDIQEAVERALDAGWDKMDVEYEVKGAIEIWEEEQNV